jgi:hypothetical protein
MMEDIPTLKLVLGWSHKRNLCTMIEDELRRLVPERAILALGDEAHAVFTEMSAEEVRDALLALVEADEGLLVAEFEKWSGYGRALDSEWLLARGH